MILNLNLQSTSEFSSPSEKLLQEGSDGCRTDDSGTSNSTIVNVEGLSVVGREDIAVFRFQFLKSTAEGVEGEVKVYGEDKGVSSEACLVTRQLFPPPSPAIVDAQSLSASRQNFVDRRFCQADSPAMAHVKLLHPQQPQRKKTRRGPRSRSSQYRGVTFYRRTGRWESHIWDSGKQVYLGGFDTAYAAARTYDWAAIKFRGVDAEINFTLSDYEEDFEQMKNLTKKEFVHILRCQSTRFSRGSSKFSGVTLNKCGQWDAHMGELLGKKYIYLGFFDSQVEAARDYDKEAVKFNFMESVTKFEPNVYEGELLCQTDGEAAGHDIDLNLSISQPSMCNSGRTDYPMGLQFHSGSFEVFDVSKIKVRAMNKALTDPLALPSLACQIPGSSALPQFSYAASSGFSTATIIAAPSLQSPSSTASYHLQLLPLVPATSQPQHL